ncbi:MAG: Rrf2 family transcriptional regulator [Bacteroidales bacterium]|jgi:Rrf2 family protein|nr:Rrf2 family transcriptional regulator [Bacteroidales bacterium]
MSKLINISEAASIAVHAMVLIARSGEMMNAGQLSVITGFSKNHISKVLNILAREQFLDSERGPKGGFILRKNPEDITLLMVYEVVDGSINQQPCANQCSLCLASGCVFGGFSVLFTNEFRGYLAQSRLSDLMKEKSVELPEKQTILI